MCIRDRLYASIVDRRRMVAASLLQATSLPFIVAATAIGLDLRLISPASAAALVGAGLVSVVGFPVVALGVLRQAAPALPTPPAAQSAHTITGGAANG